MEMDQFKWGVIGSMEKAQAFAADLPYAIAEHMVVAILTDEPQPASSDPAMPKVYTDLQAFLSSDIDAVYIISAYSQHYAYAKQCLLAHKPVLCERPIATDAEELEHLIRLSQNNHTFMMEAMWIRFLPSVKKVLGVISSGAIGDIISIKASVNPKNTISNNVASGSGGALFELGTYPVFLCVLFLGRPDYVQGVGNNTIGGANQFFSAFLSYEEGQYGFIEASTINKGNSYAVIEGDKGVIKIKNPWSAKPEGIEVDFFDGTKVLHKGEWEGSGFQFEADEVYKCLQNGSIESQLYPHQFSLDVMKTLDDIRQKLK